MEKAFVHIAGLDADNGEIRLVYKVIYQRDQEPPIIEGSGVALDVALSANENADALKNKIARDGAEHGLKLTVGDVIPFGALMLKDLPSGDEKSKGITSDRTATVIIETVKEQVTLTAQATDALKRAATWLIS